MYDIINNNAYGILGLLPNSTQKEISRRLKEIEKLIQIDEIPLYEYDFGHYSALRTLQNVKTAFQNISNSKTILLEYFFRIYTNKENEKIFFENINKNFCYETILEYYNHVDRKTFSLKKNTAILLSLLLLTRRINNCEEIVNMNIVLWHEILNNSKYIKDFQKIYLLDDEIGIDESLFENIEETINFELINIFSNITKVQKNNNILSKFINEFNLTNKTYIIPQVEDIYKKIDTSIKKLNELKISEDGIFDDDEKSIVKQCLSSFQDEFNNLVELGLYDSEKTIILRDLVATSIRIQILDLFNNLREDEIALKLMQFASYIAGTEGLKTKLNDELNHISSNVEGAKILDPIHKKIDYIEKNIRYISLLELKEISQEIAILLENLCNKTCFPEKVQVELFDVIAIRLRELAVKMHNQYEKFKEAQILINLSLGCAKSQKLKDVCLQDLMTINRTVDARCGVKGFLNNSGLGGCFIQILGYIIVWVVIMAIGGILSLFGG